jgi:hypothetical protein
MALKSSLAVSVFFKILFLSINLVTGILIARNVSLSERGIGGTLFSLAAIFSVWLSADQNESSLRNPLYQENIEINIPEQLTLMTILIIISFLLNLQVNLPWIYLMILFSFYNSRLLNQTFNSKGMIIDRLLQLLHLMAFLILIIFLSIFKLLDLNHWITISLIIEIFFSTVLVKISGTTIPLFRISYSFESLKKKLVYDNLFYVTDMLGDRIAILILAFALSSPDIAILSIAMSFLLIIGIPFTSSYPYPVKHARDIQIRLQEIGFKKFAYFVFAGLIYALFCVWGIIEFIPLVYGSKYSSISKLAVAIVFAAFFLSFAKLLSGICRGLSRDFSGNKLIFLAVALSSISAVSLRELVNPLQLLFTCLGISNMCIALYLFHKIRYKEMI